MTILVWDGKTLAADKRLNRGDNVAGVVTKIKKLENGKLLGYCGASAFQEAAFDWVERGANPERYPKPIDTEDYIGILVINTDKSIQYFEANRPYPICVENDKFSFGAAGDIGDALMMVGIDARECVEIASRVLGYCGNGIDTLTLD
jgi:hypothetical protein